MCDSHRRFGGQQEGGVAVAEPPSRKQPKEEWQSDEGGDDSVEVEVPPERRPPPAPAPHIEQGQDAVRARTQETLGDAASLGEQDPSQRKLATAGGTAQETGLHRESPKTPPSAESGRPVPALPDATTKPAAETRGKVIDVVSKPTAPPPPATKKTPQPPAKPPAAKQPERPTASPSHPPETKKPAAAPITPLSKKPSQAVRPQQPFVPRTTPTAQPQLSEQERRRQSIEKRLVSICDQEGKQRGGTPYYSWRATAANTLAMVLGTTQLPSGVEARRRMEFAVFNQLRQALEKLGVDESKWPRFLKQGA
ncbi:TPA: hypothetical protein DCL30_00110 [Candidatus Peribacteria bacterium]|nr:MAG: hypothetical protein A3J91_05195 [Candidatus Peribacteria bacterium RIFOXYC2_FULL_58_10]OGJ84374.1 MAG: hypothetical protein A2529_03185 [Candidatus Peribacteria bacterium RIFOXYD2_FULL_58_15]HAI97935.1 hypothetical protein [Candidatus Peribacteria bacterium]HAS34699.1 hypothetical protein [Candidatus Peribacteria bacterium]